MGFLSFADDGFVLQWAEVAQGILQRAGLPIPMPLPVEGCRLASRVSVLEEAGELAPRVLPQGTLDTWT